ncbi:hypothetical protein [Yersinia rohdei]|nr:hypothetical protein [Yersinia rohdei]
MLTGSESVGATAQMTTLAAYAITAHSSHFLSKQLHQPRQLDIHPAFFML